MNTSARGCCVCWALIAGCAGEVPETALDAGSTDSEVADTTPIDAAAAPCPPEMVLVADTCMDRFEAPNLGGALPLVMYTFDQSEAWCSARGKRLCFDDEWLLACAGPDGFAYPYGNTRVPGQCNDDTVWRTYTQSLLSAWPYSASATEVTSLADLLDRARAIAPGSADHVEALYQGTGGGEKAGCGGAFGVFDLSGNVEEWTRRRTSTDPSFEGNLKGRYWAESRTCQGNVTTHGDGFRFYEIGFRCCRAPR